MILLLQGSPKRRGSEGQLTRILEPGTLGRQVGLLRRLSESLLMCARWLSD